MASNYGWNGEGKCFPWQAKLVILKHVWPLLGALKYKIRAMPMESSGSVPEEVGHCNRL